VAIAARAAHLPGGFAGPPPPAARLSAGALCITALAAAQLDQQFGEHRRPEGFNGAGPREGGLPAIGPTNDAAIIPYPGPAKAKTGPDAQKASRLRFDGIMLAAHGPPDGVSVLSPWGLKLQVRTKRRRETDHDLGNRSERRWT